MALLELLRHTQTGEDISELVNRIESSAKEAYAKTLEAKSNAKAVINAIAEGTFVPEKQNLEDDGTSI